MSNRREPLVPQSYDALDLLKQEISNELGIEVPHGTDNGQWGYVPAARCGDVGGNMVKKMIESFEKNLIK